MKFKQIDVVRGKGYICSYTRIEDDALIQFIYRGSSFFGRPHPYRRRMILKDVELWIFGGEGFWVKLI